MSALVRAPKKLIEVALPLDAINAASAREKSIRHGHPSTLHLWWARRPLAAARAVIFAQMVNDPSWRWELENGGEIPPNHLKASWAASRRRLFAILEELVTWESTISEEILEKARAEIRKSWRETCDINKEHPRAAEMFNPSRLPAFCDPFAGGGTLPLEAQRLGLDVHASDLNPVAVLINKAMIEIPSTIAGKPPVNPEARLNQDLLGRPWGHLQGVASDVRYYGRWMRAEARKRIGHLYPTIEVTSEIAKERHDLMPIIGKQLTVVAWLWARTVKSPNPAYRDVDVPLVATFVLSDREGTQAYVQPVIDRDAFKFAVKSGRAPAEAKSGTKLSRGADFRCLMSGSPIAADYIRAEAKAKRMGARLMAVVAESPHGRIYLPPTPEHESAAPNARPDWKPDVEFFQKALGFRVGNYGMTKWSHLFTDRQLLALTTFSDLILEAREQAKQDALVARSTENEISQVPREEDAIAYADALSVYLAFCVDKMTDTNTCLCSWQVDPPRLRATFGRQALPMVWDYAEANVFGDAAGDFGRCVQSLTEVLDRHRVGLAGHASQEDATSIVVGEPRIFSTDPPYYDNVGYADLSDFFYVWLRKSLRAVLPDLFATVATPKAEELVATPDRHGGQAGAEAFFLDGMTRALHRLADGTHPAFPVTIYYAFKQSESAIDAGTSSTGWETFLDAVLRAGFVTAGTWPMRSELATRNRGRDSNALASSIVLSCRRRPPTAQSISRREFLRELNKTLPEALDEMTRGAGEDRSPIAPVDLSQAIIGPGMAIFSKYNGVLEADGKPMSVRTALQLINRFLAEDDFDHDTQFCLHWFQQHGWTEGTFGEADTLARAKGTSVDGVKHGGILYASGGIVRLLKWVEYATDWEPETDRRLPVWEALHQLIRLFKTDGEGAAGAALARIQSKTEATRQLAYRLYTLCERAGWAEDARAYNEIVTSWNAIESAATAAPTPTQATLFG